MLGALIDRGVTNEGAVIQLTTRCTSTEEFIERFARFTSATDVVVPALPNVIVGTTGQFVILLKDGSAVMRGRCEVTEIRPVAGVTGEAPATGRALMRLHMREMDAHSAGIHLRLMERQAAIAKAAPAPAAAPSPEPPPPPPARVLSLVPPEPVRTPAPGMTPPPPLPARIVPPPVLVPPPPVAAVAAAVAVAPTPLEPERSEATEIAPLPRPETRAAGAPSTLPANPLSSLAAADLADFVELTLLETSGPVNAAPRGDRDPGAARARLDRARRIAVRGIPYASCVIAGLLLGIAFRPDAKVAVVVGAPSVVPPRAEIAAPVVAAPAAPDEDPAPPGRDCVARVTTTPAGVAVRWGNIDLGTSPLERAVVPCGPASVTFRRERWAETTRTITADREHRTVVTERLSRPPAKLVVVSSPAHARIKVNNRRFGATPRKISTMRFEHVRVEASLPGYRPWRKTVYLSDAESRVDVTLVPTKRNARTN